jgi:flagellar biosynthetic protein FliO
MKWVRMNREVLTAVLAMGIASSVVADDGDGAQPRSREATTPSSAPPILSQDSPTDFAVASADDAGPSAFDVSSGTSGSAVSEFSDAKPGVIPALQTDDAAADPSVESPSPTYGGYSCDVTSAGLMAAGEPVSASAPGLPAPADAQDSGAWDPPQGEFQGGGSIGPVVPARMAEVLPPRAPTGPTSVINAAHTGGALPRTIPGGHRPWYHSGLLALGAVLALIFAVMIVVRRYVPSVRAMSGGALKVISRVHLSPKQSVALVQVGPRLILIGVTPDRLTPLGEISDPREVSDLRSRAGVGVDSATRAHFEEALASEAAQYEAARQEEEEALPVPEASDGPADGTHRVQETLGQLRTLVTQLRSLQQSTK